MAPWNILALTFTNKAANEMKTRIGQLVGGHLASRLYMGTFHSIFARILRVEAARLGYTAQYTIYDESDSRSLIKQVIKELQLDDKVYKPASVHARISMAKNHLITAAAYSGKKDLMERDRQSKMPSLHQIFVRYDQRLRHANAMDFDDLLVNTHRLFEDDDVRRQYADRFRYVLVDEYQDTNLVQQAIVFQLTKDHQHLCVVGDDAQSIYGFRGANIDNMLDFSKFFPSVRLFKLERNYRSTQMIVGAAGSLIRHNRRQIPKEVYSEKTEGEPLALREAASDKEEALIVCREIQRLRGKENLRWQDFAVLYRTNAQSRSFEEEMRKNAIPYRIFGGMSFYQRKEIKDIIAYFRLVFNPDDEEAFRRIINYPARGIGDTTVGKIAEASREQGVSFYAVAESPAQYGLALNASLLRKLDAFCTMIRSFRARVLTDDVYLLGRDIIQQSGIRDDLYATRDVDAISRQENLEEFLGAMQDFTEARREEGREENVFLPDFLQEVSLLSDLDSDDGDENERVSLMTVHSAKGLEFPVVFVVGLEENLFPSALSMNSQRELEEERRLLYVAITRAERLCYLTYAKCRWRYGKMEFGTPSRFLSDIDGDFIGRSFSNDLPFAAPRRSSDTRRDSWARHVERPVSLRVERPKTVPQRPSGQRRLRPLSALTGETPSSVSSSTAVMPVLREGDRIEHQRFGLGEVIRIEGTGENTKATVRFQYAGEKQLLLKFAKFTKV